jgi:hypothetical protein
VCPGPAGDEEYDSAVDAYAHEKLSHSVHIIYREQPIQSVFEPGRVKFVPYGYNTTEEFVEFLFKLNDELEEAIKRVFTSFDADNSGFIDSNELQSVSRELGKELTEEELKQVLNELDENRDGKISYEEFRNWWKSGRRASGRVMKKLTSLRAKAKKLINAVTASTEVLEDLYGKDIETLANFSVAFNQGPEIENPGLKVNVNAISGESEERAHLTSLASLEGLEKDFFLTLTFKLQEGKDPEAVKDKLNNLVSKIMLRFVSSGGRSTRKLVKSIEYRLRSNDQYVYLYIYYGKDSKFATELNFGWDQIKFALPANVQQTVSVELKLKNGLKAALERAETSVLLTLLEHFRVKVQGNLWTQLAEYGLRYLEGKMLDDPYHGISGSNFLMISSFLLTNAEIEFNATTLTEFTDKLIAAASSSSEIRQIVGLNKEVILEDAADVFRGLSRQLPFIKNILIFLRENIDTELVQVFFNFFNLSAKLKVEGDSFLNLLSQVS